MRIMPCSRRARSTGRQCHHMPPTDPWKKTFCEQRGYNGIQQDTSARAYPHRLHTWDTWGIHAAMMYPIVAGEIHAGYIQDTCWIQRSMCILEESIRHMQDTCGIHAGYIQDTCSKDVSSRGLWDTCEIHAGYSLQTCILREK